jgi:predicted permease
MARLATALDRQYPKWSGGRAARVVLLQESLVGRVRPWMLMLLGAVVLVLLIACANVANLMLARATMRRRDAAVRAALGAPRWRLLRVPLLEALVLASAGALGGLVLAAAAVRVLRAWLPYDLPRVAAVAIDWRVLAAAVGAALLTGLLAGLAPGIQALRQDARGLTGDGRSPVSASAAGRRTRNALVVAEVALAALLLVGAGLFGRSFWNVARIDPGFDRTRVLTLQVGLPIDGRRLDDEFARRSGAYLAQVLDAVRRVPGVVAAGTVSGGLPLSGNWSRWSVELPGRGELTGEGDDIDVRRVSASYLKVMRIPLVRGRQLDERDTETSQAVVVINRAAARKYWPDRDALGQHITMGEKQRLVVGIVNDVHQMGPEIAPRQEAYIPAAQSDVYGATLVVRTAASPLEVLPSLKSAIWRINREQRLGSEVVTLDGYMDRLIGQRRFLMALTLLLGCVGLVIATAGVYGVMRYTVAQRTSEVGLRMALGATPAIVLATVVREGALLLAIGLVIGCAGAWALGASVQAFLFQVKPNDPAVFAAAAAALGITGLLASLVPARRAALVDPLVALRQN